MKKANKIIAMYHQIPACAGMTFYFIRAAFRFTKANRNAALIPMAITTMLLFSCGKNTSANKTDLIPRNNTTKKFFNQDGQFKIQFEADPTVYSQYVPYEKGKILMSYFIYEKGINLIYCISYADYPESFTIGKVPEDILSDLLDTYINTQKAGLEVQKMVSFNSHPGIYFKASNSDTFVFGEYVLRKNRLYQLTVTKEGSYHNEVESNAFLGSLELL